VQETHRKHILLVKPFHNITLNSCNSVTELLVHFDFLLPDKHELPTMQDSRHHRHIINSQIRATDRLWHRFESLIHQPSVETLSEAYTKSFKRRTRQHGPDTKVDYTEGLY